MTLKLIEGHTVG